MGSPLWFEAVLGIQSRSCRSFVLTLIFSWLFWNFGRISHLWWTLLWVLLLGLERRLPMVLHSLALCDVVTLWVESVFILERSEGLAVFAGVSSSVTGHLSVSLAEWALVMFSLLYVSSSFGWVQHVSNVLPPHTLLWLSPWGFSFLSGRFSLWLPCPGVNPLASMVTLLYSFRLTQTSISRTVLYVWFAWGFVSHITLHCLPDGLQFFCHGPFLVLLQVPMVRLCCLLSLGSYNELHWKRCLKDLLVHPRRHLKKKKKKRSNKCINHFIQLNLELLNTGTVHSLGW